MRTINGVLTLVLGLAGCRVSGEPAAASAPADPAAGEVAMAGAGPDAAALLVPVHINGAGPFNLVLDTGATFTCVTTELAEQLQLPDQRGAVGIGAGVHTTARVRIIRYDSVRVGLAVVHDMPGCVLDLSALDIVETGVDGLLGLNFLRAFDVQLDFRRGILTLTSPAN
jgi:predicted aspartyl protease